MWAYQLSRACECWAATWAAAPDGPRITIGTGSARRTCSGTWAAWFTIWSRARIEKLKVIISAIGRMPRGRPTATPAIASSAIGVSRTRHSPNSWTCPG